MVIRDKLYQTKKPDIKTNLTKASKHPSKQGYLLSSKIMENQNSATKLKQQDLRPVLWVEKTMTVWVRWAEGPCHKASTNWF